MRLTPPVKTLVGLLVLTFVLSLASTPGVGLETRAASDFPPLLAAGFAVAALGPAVLALVALKWPRPAAWAALGVAVLGVLLNAADIAGLASPLPAPGLMLALESLLVLLHAAIAWAAWRIVRAPA